MDEIKAMQQNSDTIPGIFEDYRQWLEAQEQQFRALRQAASQVNAHSLHSVDSLLSGMEQAASQMPLPEMDIKPDFKHIDAMEEPPRHVVQQKDLDDMVPNARVFRQMNLMMDGDRSNNINVAFGQVNELRHQAPEESGPVQEKHSIPRWQKILGGILSAFMALAAVWGIYQALADQWFDAGIWGLFLLFLLLRLLLAAIPLWKSHRQWLEDAQKKDAETGGRQYAAAQAAEQKRRNRLIGLGVGGGVLVIVLVAVLCRVLYAQAHPQADYTVCMLTSRELSDHVALDFSKTLSPLVGDLDGNGTAVCQVEQRVLDSYANAFTPDQVKDIAYRGVYPLLLLVNYDIPYLDDPVWNNAVTTLNRKQYCAPLPEDLPSEDGYVVDLSQVPSMQSKYLGSLGLYACIPIGDSQEEYDFAVSILRQLLQSAN